MVLPNICHTRCCQLLNDPTHRDLPIWSSSTRLWCLQTSSSGGAGKPVPFFLQSTSHSSQLDVDIKYTCLLIPGLPKRCGLPIAGLAAGIENCWDWELHEDLDVENDPNHLVCALC